MYTDFGYAEYFFIKPAMAHTKSLCIMAMPMAFSMFLASCGNTEDRDVSMTATEKDKPKNEIVTKIDYSPTQTGFALSPFSGSGSEFSFTGGMLHKNGKSMTGTLREEIGMLTKGDGKYQLIRESGAAIKSWEVQKEERMDITFDAKLSKMKFMGSRYSYEEKNLRLGQKYGVKCFESQGSCYVLEFENKTESTGRDEKYEEFLKAIKEVKSKYAGDPKTINAKIGELREAYGMDVRKFK